MVRLVTEQAPPSSPRFLFIQALRGIAALMVVAFHCWRELHWRGRLPDHDALAVFGIFDFGVDLFFVISGFVMVHSTRNLAGGWRAAGHFLRRRLLRIAPMYWGATLLFLLPLLAAPHLLRRSGYTAAYIAASFGFIPWQRPLDVVPSVSPIYGLGWTLNYEMAFYALLAALVGIGARRRVPIVCVVMLALAIAGFAVPPTMPQAYFYTRSLLLEFAFGAMACVALQAGYRLSVPAALALIAAGTILWLAGGLALPLHDGTNNLRGLVWGPAAAAIVGGAVLASPRSGPSGSPAVSFWSRLGDASYSLYLSHLFILRLLSMLLAQTPVSTATTVGFALLAVILSCGCGWLLHCTVEKRILARQGDYWRIPQSA